MLHPIGLALGLGLGLAQELEEALLQRDQADQTTPGCDHRKYLGFDP